MSINNTYKDISINELSYLSNKFIEEQLTNTVNMYQDIKPEPIDQDIEMDAVINFITLYMEVKYTHDNLNDYEWKDNEKAMFYILEHYYLEKEIDRHIRVIEERLILNRKAIIDDTIFETEGNLSFLVEKHSTRNKDTLLRNYNEKTNKFTQKYNNENYFTENELLNIKNIIGGIKTDPTYSSNLQKFNNEMFRQFTGNERILQDSNLVENYEIEDDSINTYPVNNIDNSITINNVTNILIYKYLNLDYNKNTITNPNINPKNLKSLLLKKLSKNPDDLNASNDNIDNRYVFSAINIDNIFKNIDVFKDDFSISTNINMERNE